MCADDAFMFYDKPEATSSVVADGTASGAGAGADDEVAEPSMELDQLELGAPEMPAAQGERGQSGERMYARLVLGRQKHTSFIKKEHSNGTVNWHQVCVACVLLH